MQEIATTFGVSRPTVYRHLSDRSAAAAGPGEVVRGAAALSRRRRGDVGHRRQPEDLVAAIEALALRGRLPRDAGQAEDHPGAAVL